jgi:hypothetical protein
LHVDTSFRQDYLYVLVTLHHNCVRTRYRHPHQAANREQVLVKKSAVNSLNAIKLYLIKRLAEGRAACTANRFSHGGSQLVVL